MSISLIKSKEQRFELLIILLILGLFSFNFWLFYPGYVSHDWSWIMYDFNLNNHHPVIYPVIFKGLGKIFGYHIYYPLLLNLVPFYVGICLCMIGFYKKYHSKWVLLLLFPVFVGNIFSANIVGYSSCSSPMFIFLLWSLLLYQLLTKITKLNMTLAVLVYILAILSRHNAVIQVFPVCFVYAYILLPKDIEHRLIKYVGTVAITAVISVLIVSFPKVYISSVATPSSHIFLHQIAGMCVPEKDSSCFDKKWYLDGKTFDDVVKNYNRNLLDADVMSMGWRSERTFRSNKLKGLYLKWMVALVNHPLNYGEHIWRFIVAMWGTRDKMWGTGQQESYTEMFRSGVRCVADEKDCARMDEIYPHKELYYKSSNTKVKIYSILFDRLPHLATKNFVSLCLVLFIVSTCFFIRKKDKRLLFSASSAFAGCAAFVIFSAFSPVVEYRYMYPVLISGIVSLIGLFVYAFDRIAERKMDSSRI